AKSGVGFYRYVKGRKKPHGGMCRMVESPRVRRGPAPALAHSDQAARIRERLVPLLINQAARCLDRGTDAAGIDLAMVLAGAWAPHRGGPLRYAAEERGVVQIVEQLGQLAQTHGPRYEPSTGLKNMSP